MNAPSGIPLRTRDRLVLAGIFVLAALLRLREAAGAPYWFDEIYTLWMTRLPWGQMLDTVALDIHPPLHFVLLKLWRALGGEGEVWIRSLSILAGLGTIGAAFGLARDACGNRAGLLAAALLAVHLVHIGVSAEARFYEFMGMWVWTAAFAAHRWVARGGAGAAALLVVAMAGGLWTHYLVGLVWSLLFGWGALALRREPRRLARWTALFAAAVALFLPQAPTFLSQLGRNTGSHWIHPPTVEDLVTLCRRVSFGAWYLVPPVVYLSARTFVLGSGRRAAGLVTAITLGPVVLTWGATLLGAHLFTARYMFFIVAGGCVLVAGGIASLTSRRAATVATVALLALALRTAWVKPFMAEATGMRAMRAMLAERATPGEPIVCGDTHTLAFLHHYGSPTPAWAVLPGDSLPYWEGALVLDPSWLRPPAAMDSLAADGGRWWFVRLRTGGMDTRATLARVVAHGARRIAAFDSLTVWQVNGSTRSKSE